MIKRYYSKNNHCIACGKLVCNEAIRCRDCARKEVGKMLSATMIGKGNHNYIDGRSLKKKHCKDCGDLIGWQAKRCRKCNYKNRNLTKRSSCSHHLDLNRKNNKKSNKLKLTYKQHQLFHRFAYHYLLEKYGIGEILKYRKWFFKYLKRKNYIFFKQ